MKSAGNRNSFTDILSAFHVQVLFVPHWLSAACRSRALANTFIRQ